MKSGRRALLTHPTSSTEAGNDDAGPSLSNKAGLTAVLLNALVIVAGTSACLLMFHLGAGRMLASLRHDQHRPFAASAATYLFLASSMVAVGMPRQVIILAAGLLFDPWLAAAVSMVAQLAACGIDYGWARILGRGPRTARLFDARAGRIGRFVAPLRNAPFRMTLCLRLLPIGSNVLVNLVAGALRVDFALFALASAIGYLPQTVVFILFGRGIRLSDWTQWAVGAALLLLSAGLAATFVRLPVARHR